MTLREKILAADDRLVKITVPEWDAEVWVRRLKLHERQAFEEMVGAYDKLDREARTTWMLKYVIEVACDSDGQRIFSPEDEAALASKSATALERVLLTAFRVNTVRTEDLVALGNGSSPVPNGASRSSSPPTSG